MEAYQVVIAAVAVIPVEPIILAERVQLAAEITLAEELLMEGAAVQTTVSLHSLRVDLI